MEEIFQYLPISTKYHDGRFTRYYYPFAYATGLYFGYQTGINRKK